VSHTGPDNDGATSGRPGAPPRHRPLEVCLASPLFPPDYSGAALRFSRYAPGLLERGIRLHVVAAEVGAWRPESGGRARDDFAHMLPQGRLLSEVHRIPIPPDGSRSRKRRAYESGVLARCRSVDSRPHVLINLSRGSLGGLMRLRRTRVPMVYVQTMHDNPSSGSVKSWLSRGYSRLRYALVDRVIVSSGAMRDGLRESGVRTPIDVVPHGVDLVRFSPGDGAGRREGVRERLGLPPTSELVVFVGPVSARKGLDHLVGAWDRVAGRRPSAHLLIVGPEEDGARASGASFGTRLRTRFAGGRGGDRVHFVGAVRDVEAYLRESEVFVFPSLREGMPNVVGEAFGCGVACVLTPFLGLSEEFGEAGREYVLVEHDGKMIGDAILGLLEDPSRRRELGSQARRWAEQELSVERSLDRYAEILWGLAPGVVGERRTPSEQAALPQMDAQNAGGWT
jgi:glycosyltransferase involved in cell wall biosynthesis